MSGNVLSFRTRNAQPLSDELQEQFGAVGISYEHLKKPLDTRGIIRSTAEIAGSFADMDKPEAAEQVQAAVNDIRVKFSIMPEQSGVVENFGYRREMSFPNGGASEEYLQISVSPTAIRRMVEPIASISRAMELVSPTEPQDQTYEKIMRIGTSSLLALALSHTAFTEFGHTLCDPVFFARSGMLADTPDDQEPMPEVKWVDEAALKFAGAVGLRFTHHAMIEQLSDDNNTDSDPATQRELELMLKVLATSRRTTGERTTRRRVSYAVENAYSLPQMRALIDHWFRRED